MRGVAVSEACCIASSSIAIARLCGTVTWNTLVELNVAGACHLETPVY